MFSISRISKDNKTQDLTSLLVSMVDTFENRDNIDAQFTTSAASRSFIKKDRREEYKMKAYNYRFELEELMEEKFFLVHARVSTKTTKHVDNMFGGYKLRTCCLDKVQCGVYKNGKIVKKITTDHLWVCEDTCTVVKDKNIEVGDIVIFKAYINEYKYSGKYKQLGILQYDPSHRNISQNYVIDYRKKKIINY